MVNNIKLLYGPTEAHGVIMHRNIRLTKLTYKLKLLGYIVLSDKISEFNALYILLEGVQIFRCRLSSLRFPDTTHLDKTLENAVSAVIEAKSRLNIAKTYYEVESNKTLEAHIFSGIIPL